MHHGPPLEIKVFIVPASNTSYQLHVKSTYTVLIPKKTYTFFSYNVNNPALISSSEKNAMLISTWRDKIFLHGDETQSERVASSQNQIKPHSKSLTIRTVNGGGKVVLSIKRT